MPRTRKPTQQGSEALRRERGHSSSVDSPSSSGNIQDGDRGAQRGSLERQGGRPQAVRRKPKTDDGLFGDLFGDVGQYAAAAAHQVEGRIIAGYTGLKTGVQVAVDRFGRRSFSAFFARSNSTLQELDKLRLNFKDPALQMTSFEINRNMEKIRARTQLLEQEARVLQARKAALLLSLDQASGPEAITLIRDGLNELKPQIFKNDRDFAAFSQYQRYFQEQAAKVRSCQLMVCDALPTDEQLFSLGDGNAAQVFVLTADKIYFVNRVYRRRTEINVSSERLAQIRTGFAQSGQIQIPLQIPALQELAQLTGFNPEVNDNSHERRAPGLPLIFIDADAITRENLHEQQIAPTKAYVCAGDGLYYVDRARSLCTKILSDFSFEEWLDTIPENQRFGTKSLSTEELERLTTVTGFRRSANAAASSNEPGLAWRAFDEIDYATAPEQDHPRDVYQELDPRHMAFLLHENDEAETKVQTLYDDMDSATSPWRTLPWYIHVAHTVFKFFGTTTVSESKGLRETYRAGELVPREYDFHMYGQAVFKQLTERLNREHFSDKPEIQNVYDDILARNETSDIGNFRILSLRQDCKNDLIGFIDREMARHKREQAQVKTTGWWARLFSGEGSVVTTKAQATEQKKSHQVRIDFLRQLRVEIKSAPRDVLDEFYTNFLRQPQRGLLQKDLAEDFKNKLASHLNASRQGTADVTDYAQLFCVDANVDTVNADAIRDFLSDTAVAAGMQQRVIDALTHIISDMKQRLPKVTWTDNKTKELDEKLRYIATLELLQQQYMLNRRHVPFNITADIKVVEVGDPKTRDARRAQRQLTLSEELIERFNHDRQESDRIRVKPSMIQRDPYAFYDLCNSYLGDAVLKLFMDYYAAPGQDNCRAYWNDLLGITDNDVNPTTRKPRFFGDGIAHGGIEARTELARRFIAAFIKPVDVVLNDEQWAGRQNAFKAFLAYLQTNLPQDVRDSQAYTLVTRCVHSIDSNELTVKQLLIEHQKSLLPPYGEAANVLFRKGQGHQATDYVKRILNRAIRRAKAVLTERNALDLPARENDEKLIYGLELTLAIIEGQQTFHLRNGESSPPCSLIEVLEDEDAQNCLSKVLISERMNREGAGETPAQYLINRYIPRHITPLLTAYRSQDVIFGKLPGKVGEVINDRAQLVSYVNLIRQVNGALGSKRLTNLVDEIATDGMMALRRCANERNGEESSLEFNRSLVPLTVLHDDPDMAAGIEAVIDQYLYGKMYGRLTDFPQLSASDRDIILSLGRIVYQPGSDGYMTNNIDAALIQRIQDFWLRVSADKQGNFLSALQTNVQTLLGTGQYSLIIKEALRVLGVADQIANKIADVIDACKRPFAFYNGQSTRYASLIFMLGSKEQQAAWAGMRFRYLLQNALPTIQPDSTGSGDSYTDESFLDFFVKSSSVLPKFADAAVAVKAELNKVTVTHAKDTGTSWSESAHELVEFYCDDVTKQFHRFKRVMEFIDPARSSVKAYNDAQRLYRVNLTDDVETTEKQFLQRLRHAALGEAGKPFSLQGEIGTYMRQMLLEYLDAASVSATNGQPWFQVAEEYFSAIAPDDLVERLRLNQFRYLLLQARSRGVSMAAITTETEAYKKLIERLDGVGLRLCDHYKAEALSILSDYIEPTNADGSAIEEGRYTGLSVEAVPFLCLMGNVGFDGAEASRCQTHLDAWLDKRMGHLFASDENLTHLVTGKHAFDETFLEHFLLSSSEQQRHVYAGVLQQTFDAHVSQYLGKSLSWNATASALIEKFASPDLVQLYRIRRLTELLAQGFDFNASKGNDGFWPNGFMHAPGVVEYLAEIQQRRFGINSLFDVTNPEVFQALVKLLDTHLAALNASPHVEKWSITSEVIFTDIAQGTNEPQLLALWASLRLNKIAYHLDTDVSPYVQTRAVSMQTYKADKAIGYSGAIVDDAISYANQVRDNSPQSGMDLPGNNERRTQIFTQYAERFDGLSLEFVPLAVLVAPTAAKITWLDKRFAELEKMCPELDSQGRQVQRHFQLEPLDKTFFEHIHSNVDPDLTNYFSQKIQKLIYNTDAEGRFISWTEYRWTGAFHNLIARYATPENRDAHRSKFILNHLTRSLGEAIRQPYLDGARLSNLVSKDVVRGGFCEIGQAFLKARVNAFLEGLESQAPSKERWHLATEQIIEQLVKAGAVQGNSLIERDDLERIQVLRIAELLYTPINKGVEDSRLSLTLEYITEHMTQRSGTLRAHFFTPGGMSALEKTLVSYVDGLNLILESSCEGGETDRLEFDFAEHAEYLFVAFAENAELELLRRQKIKELLYVGDINKSSAYREMLRTYNRPECVGSNVPVVFSGLFEQTLTGAKDLDDVFNVHQVSYPWSENAEFLIASFGSAERLDLYHVKRLEELIKLEACGAPNAIIETDQFLRRLKAYGIDNLVTTAKGKEELERLLTQYLAEDKETNMVIAVLLTHYYPAGEDAPLRRQYNLKRIGELLLQQKPYFKCDSNSLPDNNLVFADEAENYWLAAHNDTGNIDLAKARFGQVVHNADGSTSSSLRGLQQILQAFCDKFERNIEHCSDDTINVLASLNNRAWMKDCLGNAEGEAFYTRVQLLINCWEREKGKREHLREFKTAVRNSNYDAPSGRGAKQIYYQPAPSSSASSSQATHVLPPKQVLAAFEEAANAEMLEKAGLLSRVLLSLKTRDNPVMSLADAVTRAQTQADLVACEQKAKSLQPLLDIDLSTTLRSPVTYLAELEPRRKAFCTQSIGSRLADSAVTQLPEIASSIDALCADIIEGPGFNKPTVISHIKDYVDLVAVMQGKYSRSQTIPSDDLKKIADAASLCYADFLLLQHAWISSRLKRAASECLLTPTLLRSVQDDVENLSRQSEQLSGFVLSIVETLFSVIRPAVADRLIQKLYMLFEAKMNDSDYIARLVTNLQSCFEPGVETSRALMRLLVKESESLMRAEKLSKVTMESGRLSRLRKQRTDVFVGDCRTTLIKEGLEFTLINIQNQFKPLFTHDESRDLQQDIDEATQGLLVHFREVQRLVKDLTLWSVALESLGSNADFENKLTAHHFSLEKGQRVRKIRAFIKELCLKEYIESASDTSSREQRRQTLNTMDIDGALAQIVVDTNRPNVCTTVEMLRRALAGIKENSEENPGNCHAEKQVVFNFIKAHVKQLETIYQQPFNVAYTMAHVSDVAAIHAKVRAEITGFVAGQSERLFLSAEDGIVLIRCLDRRARQQLISQLNVAVSTIDPVSQALARHFTQALASGNERSKETHLFLFYYELAKLKADITRSTLTSDFFKAVADNIYPIREQLSVEERNSIKQDLDRLSDSNGFVKELCDYVTLVLDGQPLALPAQVDAYLACFSVYKDFGVTLKKYRDANTESLLAPVVRSDSAVDLRSRSVAVFAQKPRSASVTDLGARSSSVGDLRSIGSTAKQQREARAILLRAISMDGRLIDQLLTLATENEAVKLEVQKSIDTIININAVDYIRFLRPLVVSLGTEEQKLLLSDTHWEQCLPILDAFTEALEAKDSKDLPLSYHVNQIYAHLLYELRDTKGKYLNILQKLSSYMEGILRSGDRTGQLARQLGKISLVYRDKLVAKYELPPEQMDLLEALMGFERDEDSDAKTPADRTLGFIQKVFADSRLINTMEYKIFKADMSSVLVGLLCKNPLLVNHAVFKDLAKELGLQLDDTYTEFNSVLMIAAIRNSLQEGEQARKNVEDVIAKKMVDILNHRAKSSEGMYTTSQMLFEPLFMLGLSSGERSNTLKYLATVPNRAVRLTPKLDESNQPVIGADGKPALIGFKGESNHPLGLISDLAGMKASATTAVDPTMSRIWGKQSAQWYRLTSFLRASDLQAKLELLGITTEKKRAEIAVIQEVAGQQEYLSTFMSARGAIELLERDLSAASQDSEPSRAINRLLRAKMTEEMPASDQLKVDIVKGLMSLYRGLLLDSAITQVEYAQRLAILDTMDTKIMAFEALLSALSPSLVEQTEASLSPSSSSDVSATSSHSHSVTTGSSNFFPSSPEPNERGADPASVSQPSEVRRQGSPSFMRSFIRNSGYARDPDSVAREVGSEQDSHTGPSGGLQR